MFVDPTNKFETQESVNLLHKLHDYKVKEDKAYLFLFADARDHKREMIHHGLNGCKPPCIALKPPIPDSRKLPYYT